MHKRKSKTKYRVKLAIIIFIFINLLLWGYIKVYTASINSINKEQILMSNIILDDNGRYNIEVMGKNIFSIKNDVSLDTQQQLLLDALIPSHIQSVTEILDFIHK